MSDASPSALVPSQSQVPAAETKTGIGELLVRDGFITPQQLREALNSQQLLTTYKPLGETCIDLGFISRNDLNAVLDRHKKRIQLGQLLINLRLISREQFKQALAEQKKSGERLGSALVRLGHLSEVALVNALSIQMGVAKVVPNLQIIDQTLLTKLSREFMLRNEAFPAFMAEGVLTVIMANPLDQRLLDDLSQIYHCRTEAAIAAASEIRKCIEAYFQKENRPEHEEAGQEAARKDLVISGAVIRPGSGENIVEIVNWIFTSAIDSGASDIHIEPEERRLRIRFRIDGMLRHITDLPISIAAGLSSRIKVLCGLDITEKRRHQDDRISARINDKEMDFRVSTYASAYGESIVFRVLLRQNRAIDINKLGFSPANMRAFQSILDQPSGIILVTGPTGSGKTTTLYGALNYLNDGVRSIITVEDPIEYTVPGIVQGQLDPKIGHTYPDFLKSMVRQDPDVIMVGEIRDNAAAEAVIQAALTGHKVLSTFHTEDSTGALLRLMDMGIDTFLISSTVVSIIAQRLVRILCPQCRRPTTPDPRLLTSFHIAKMNEIDFPLFEPVGCDNCGGTGFKGRMPIHELLLVNDAVRDAILARKTSSQIRFIARRRSKLICMREDGFYKACQGLTSLEEVTRAVFFGETEDHSPREAAEVIALCEGREYGPSREGKAEGGKGEEVIRISDASMPTVEAAAPARTALPSGELYRIRFETATIESERYRIGDFFHELQRTMVALGRPVGQEAREPFTNSLAESVKRLEMTGQVEAVEFILRVDEGHPRILMEAMVERGLPQGQASLRHSRETGLKHLGFLMPASGLGRMEKVSTKGGRGSLLSFLKGSEPLLPSPQGGTGTALLSEMHRQEIDLTECLTCG